MADNNPDRLVRELRQVAAQLEEAQSRRDELIGALHRAGVGIREIGRAAGIAHTSVLHILRRDGVMESPE